MDDRKEITTAKAPKPIGAYSQAVTIGGMIFFSGQIGLHPEDPSHLQEEFKAQLIQVFENIKHIIAASKISARQVAKLNIYLTDLNDFDCVNELLPQYFDPPFPARAVVQVSALPKGAKVEIDGFAVANPK